VITRDVVRRQEGGMMSAIGCAACTLCLAAGLLAGCSDKGNPPEGSVANAGAPPILPPDATMPACLVGSWRSAALPAGTRLGPLNASASGGEGIAVSIGPYGAVTVGFTSMQPIVFSVSIGSTVSSGVFSYAGSAAGTVTAELVGAPPVSGLLRPATVVDWTYTRLTVQLADPGPQRPFDNVALDRYTGAGAAATGEVVDIDPFFDPGRFTCLGSDALDLTPNMAGELPLHLVRM
jgi:hypothetical protein